jgi:Ca-activated chloride channel homolog
MKTNLKNIIEKLRESMLLTIVITGFSSCAKITAQSPAEKDMDKTLSPYFFVLSDNSEVDQLPLKLTSADVNIAGVVANVKVTQIYKNEGKNTLEAIYIFPASTRAAVYDMKMTIGERTIQAIIMEREQARHDYEKAKQEGKSASLLEQQRPNVFQMNVANILPGDEIKVELYYTELLIPEKGTYEFIYPTVVGPRYSNKPEDTATSNDQWVSNPYTTEGKKASYKFDLHVKLNAGIPIKDVNCASHETDISYQNANSVSIGLKKGNEYEGNRDFILKYRLQGSQIQSGLLLYNGKDENFFLAMVQPPQRVTLNQIPPREYVFIMDVSGSMNGFPIDISKKLMVNLLRNLRSTDKFNVVLFAGCSNLLSETSLPVNEDNIQKAIQLIDKQEGAGGTEIVPALQKALALKGVEGFSRTFVIATDGYVDVEKETFDLIRNNLGKANFFAFGIGTSVNRYIIEGMARVGNGEPFIIEQPEKANIMAERFREYIQTPLLTNVKLSFPGFDVYDAEPLNIPDLLAERPLLIYGKYHGNPSGQIVITGKTGEGAYKQSFNVSETVPLKENQALTYLWARNRIAMLDDYSKVPGDFEKIKKEVLNLGLKYNLLTAYTSFIAIDSEVRNKTGNSTTVKQPLPLPQGVNNNAIGNNAASYSTARKSVSFAPQQTISSDMVMEANDAKEEEIVEREEPVFLVVEEPATFNGGDVREFLKYVMEHIQYPKELTDAGISGKVYVQFTVDVNGKISDIKILRGIDPLLDQEVIRVLQNAPSWTPAKQGGKIVKQQFTLPVVFTLKTEK